MTHDVTAGLVRVALRDTMPSVLGFELKYESTGSVIESVIVLHGREERAVTPDEWEALRRAGAPLTERNAGGAV